MRLQKAYETYGKKADFYWVYIREAHPIGSSRPSPLQIARPKPTENASKLRLTCSAGLNLKIPLLVDDINDTVASAFSAFPDRLYIIGKDGKIAYQGGPREFSVPEMTATLEKIIEKTN